jgi:hypothetical protein
MLCKNVLEVISRTIRHWYTSEVCSTIAHHVILRPYTNSYIAAMLTLMIVHVIVTFTSILEIVSFSIPETIVLSESESDDVQVEEPDDINHDLEDHSSPTVTQHCLNRPSAPRSSCRASTVRQ